MAIEMGHLTAAIILCLERLHLNLTDSEHVGCLMFPPIFPIPVPGNVSIFLRSKQLDSKRVSFELGRIINGLRRRSFPNCCAWTHSRPSEWSAASTLKLLYSIPLGSIS